MPISSNEKAVLRKLAEEYMEIATLPVHREKVELWKALNRCKMQRPMVCIDQLPWNELEIDDSLKCRVEDKFFRNIERTLRRTIYKWKHFPVDMVVEPYITIPKTITSSGYGLAPQAERLSLHEGSTAPSRHYERVLNNYDDLEKITDIQFTVDNEMSELHLQQAKDIFDGIAPVVQGRGVQFSLGVWDYLTMLIGIDEVYYEFFDNPDFIHACVDRLTNSVISGIKQANELMIHDDIAQTCHCSYIYTDELLPSFGQGKGPVSKNCWAFGLAQLFTSVSPQTMDEFEIPYVSRMAEYFGMIYYGCCDRLDDRLDIVKKIPNVKKVSCSPWSDRAKFAENIGSDIIMSNKPAPAFLAADTVDWDSVKNDLKYTVDVAKANNVNLELILKDISTVRFEPGRLTKWAQIAMEVVESC
jgi:hypothetical protein